MSYNTDEINEEEEESENLDGTNEAIHDFMIRNVRSPNEIRMDVHDQPELRFYTDTNDQMPQDSPAFPETREEEGPEPEHWTTHNPQFIHWTDQEVTTINRNGERLTSQVHLDPDFSRGLILEGKSHVGDLHVRAINARDAMHNLVFVFQELVRMNIPEIMTLLRQCGIDTSHLKKTRGCSLL